MSSLSTRFRKGLAESTIGEAENLERKRRVAKAKLDELRDQNIIINDPSLSRQAGLAEGAKEAQKQAGLAEFLSQNSELRDKIIREEIAKKEREAYLAAIAAEEARRRFTEEYRNYQARNKEEDDRTEELMRAERRRLRRQRREERQFVEDMEAQRQQVKRQQEEADQANEERARVLGERRAIDKISKGLEGTLRERRAAKEAERQREQQAKDIINRVMGERVRIRRAKKEMEATVPEEEVLRPAAAATISTPSRRGRPPVAGEPNYNTAVKRLLDKKRAERGDPTLTLKRLSETEKVALQDTAYAFSNGIGAPQKVIERASMAKATSKARAMASPLII